MRKFNPFLKEGYVSPEYFCNRESETRILLKSAEEHKHYALFSIRRLGKTGLIHHASGILKKKKVKVMYLDIMMTSSFREFVYLFVKEYFNSTADISQKILKTASSLLKSFSPALSADPVTGKFSLDLNFSGAGDPFEDMERIFGHIEKSDYYFFIAIDEFQQILNYPEQNAEAFLRSKMQNLHNVSFVFSGSKKHLLLSIFGDYSRPFWQNCGFMELKAIDRIKYSEFIKKKFREGGKIIEEEAVKRILNETGGITYFVQLICHDLYNLMEKKIGAEIFEEVFLKILKEREAYYLNYLNLLTQKQRQVYMAAALEENLMQPMGAAFISKYNLGGASSVRVSLKSLIEKELIYEAGGRYLTTDPLFPAWLKRRTIEK